MIITLQIIFIILVSIFIIRKSVNSKSQLQFEYELFEIRDELRSYAINKEIDCENDGFNYLDKTISLHIQQSYSITLFRLVANATIYSQDENLQKKQEYINQLLSKDKKLLIIQEKLVNSIQEYVFRQHIVSIVIFLLPIIYAVNQYSNAKNWVRRLSKGLLYSPSSSYIDEQYNRMVI